MCANNENTKKEIDNLKLDLREHKGYVLGKFDHYSHELKDLGEKVTKIETTITDKFKNIEEKFQYLETQFREGMDNVIDICDDIKTSVQDIENSADEKETKTDNKLWVLIGQIVSPLVVLSLWTLVQHFLK
jgi:septation ring formation regulator EzrA